MSYQTGTALDVNDLLDRFRLFLQAAGWGIDYWGDRLNSAGAGKALQVNAAGLFYSWFTDTTTTNSGPSIQIAQHTAFSNPGDTVQPGVSPYVRSNRLTAPMQAYHFFAGEAPSGKYAYMVVETDPGTYRHLGMGVLKKVGAYTGGQFVFASNWSTSVNQGIDQPNSQYNGVPFDDTGTLGFTSGNATVVRADYDNVSPRYHIGDYGATAQLRCGWRQDNDQRGTVFLPYSAAASTITGRAPLIPLWCAVPRGSSLWSDIGYPVDMRLVRMDNMEPGQDYPLGTDTWLVFPVARKNGAAGSVNSGVHGFAYRREG